MSDATPSDRELEALKVLWRRGEASVREVADELNATGAGLAYTTVLSLLQVMEQKDLVGHRRQGRAYLYRALVERASTFRGLAAGFLYRVFDGAIDEYLVHALGGRKLSDAELDELEAMIARARNEASAKPHSKKGSKQ